MNVLKIIVLSNDTDLFHGISVSGLFDEVKRIHSINEIDSDSDVILISDEFIPYNNLTELNIAKKQKAFYMLSNHHENILKTVKTICDSRDIILIPPRLTVTQIIQHLKDVFAPDHFQKNVVNFFSTISNVGTTSTCLSVAQAIQANSSAKIGVLLLNAWDDGTDQINYKGKYLDEIKSQLTDELIESEDEFLSLFHMQEKDKFYILAGNRDTKMERLFTKEEIHFIIDKAKSVFDIVLIDSGCHFDNVNMVQALLESDLRFLVFNQQYKAIKKFQHVYNDILYPLGYNVNDFFMVINSYEDRAFRPSSKDIFIETKVPIITTITKNENGIVSEGEKKILYHYDDDDYKEAINLLAKSIASHSGIEISFGHKKRKRFFALK